MKDLMTALLWLGGPALVLGAFAMVQLSVGASQRWASRWWDQR